MRHLCAAWIILLFSASAFSEEKKDPTLKKGLIVYIEGIRQTATHDLILSLVKFFKEQPVLSFSASTYAALQNAAYYPSAIHMFHDAVMHARKGEVVFLDADIIEPYFQVKMTQEFDIVTVGIWCQLECLQKRFLQQAPNPNIYEDLKYEYSKIEKIYHQRYGKMSRDEIMKIQGTYDYDFKRHVIFDLFLDTENLKGSDLAKSIFQYLQKNNPQYIIKEVPKKKRKSEWDF